MGKFKTFLVENDSPWREDLDLRYVHDHMGKDFLKLLVQYEDGGLDAVPMEMWARAVAPMVDRLEAAGELENMEHEEKLAYASVQLSSALRDYVTGED